MKKNRQIALGAVLALAVAACGGGPSESLQEEVVENYAALVHGAYVDSLASANEMDAAIVAFVADPTEASLVDAQAAWLTARDDYGPTEAFRFYGGPIDDDDIGVEGLLNAWPLDEAYIDYVEGNPDAGIVNNPDLAPTIDHSTLLSLNEVGGETNISTGWHAIEFLLWGQDLNENGAGERPVEDYTTNPNADRRGQYLTAASSLLLVHLESLVDAWAPDADNFAAEFLALPTEEALGNIMTSAGELSRGELAGERMTVAYSERSQEDEHSCFSDNTHNDIIANALGIQALLTGDLGSVEGPGILDLVEAADSELADTLTAQINDSVANAREIPAPFDQHLREGVADSDPGRVSVLTTIESLETQTDSIVEAAELLEIPINLG